MILFNNNVNGRDNLKRFLKETFDRECSGIKDNNRETERDYFSSYANSIPFGNVFDGCNFDDILNGMKVDLENGLVDEVEIDRMFIVMTELMYFSGGHDMMFKHKIKADCFHPAPIESVIYPILETRVCEEFNDVSIMPENDRRQENIDSIIEETKIALS